MANVKISDLPAAASASAGQEFEVNESGTSKKVTGAQIATYVEGVVSSDPTFTGQVSLADGSNTAPSLTNTGDTNTGIYFPASDEVAITTGGTERVRFNSGGVDVVGGNISVGAAGVEGGQITFRNPDGSTEGGIVDISSANVMRIFQTANNSIMEIGQLAGTGGTIKFYTAGSERVRIDSSGNLLVGTTSATAPVGGIAIRPNTIAGAVFCIIDRVSTTATSYPFEFRNGGSVVGQISYTNTTTTYATSSDYRLKEDVQPMSGASDRVLALNPVNFAWKADGTRVDGFLAHEAQVVVPEAVTGEKDAIDADGKPVYQGIDQSKLVPLLTAALQEALTKIEALEARVAQLEGN